MHFNNGRRRLGVNKSRASRKNTNDEKKNKIKDKNDRYTFQRGRSDPWLNSLATGETWAGELIPGVEESSGTYVHTCLFVNHICQE